MPRLGLGLLLLAAAALVAGCGSNEAPPLPSGPAPPQKVALAWVERFPEQGPALVFSAHGFEVTSSGWTAELEVENDTPTTWRVAQSPATAFGVMLFTSDEAEEVEQRSRDDDLPGLRPARTFDPALPARLPPGASWVGTMSAPGPLAAGLHVRLVFGRLVAVGTPPKGMPTEFSWITDHSYALRSTQL
jgi:hypothetical protein